VAVNGPIEFWNPGAERLYGVAPEEASGTVATLCFEQNSRSNLTSGLDNLKMNVTGQANFVMSARMAAAQADRSRSSQN
jgi:hypothetical protein